MSFKKKYIFVTGGVVSGLGKGIVASSIGLLLEQEGFKVKVQKNDPYFNINAGTLKPSEHGETFVLNDGAETDLDLGHYERFLNKRLDRRSTSTSGKIYKKVLEDEESGKYLGKTVQLIPHVSNEIIKNFTTFEEDNDCDIVIIEIGGTVGDYESQIYLESIRQLKDELDTNLLLVHVSLLPFISGSKEIKSKPTQHSVMALQQFGLKPDILVCRTDSELDDDMKRKLSTFCHLPVKNIIENETVRDIYLVPSKLAERGIVDIIYDKLKLIRSWPNNMPKEDYSIFIQQLNKYYKDIDFKIDKPEVHIGLLGKYLKLDDAYLSIYESLRLAGIHNDMKIQITKINTDLIVDDKSAEMLLNQFDGIVVPGGFGERLTKEIMIGLKYLRTNNVPTLGICYGLQLMAVEYATNVLNLKASSEEWQTGMTETVNVVHYLNDQRYLSKLSGTMRLGNYEMEIMPGTLLMECYKNTEANMKHRHRLEINEKYFKDTNFKASGISKELGVVEAMELQGRDFYIGVQGHPELDTTIFNPNPLFVELVKKAFSYKNKFKNNKINKVIIHNTGDLSKPPVQVIDLDQKENNKMEGEVKTWHQKK